MDYVITSYRAHGFIHVMGVPVLGVLGKLAGKKSGVIRCICTPRTSTVETELLEIRYPL